MSNIIEDAILAPVESSKAYVKPRIVHELKLETRAGTGNVPPSDIPDILDPLGINPK